MSKNINVSLPEEALLELQKSFIYQETIFVMTYVGTNKMFRRFKVFYRQGRIYKPIPNELALAITQRGITDKGIGISGCGMNMGFALWIKFCKALGIYKQAYLNYAKNSAKCGALTYISWEEFMRDFQDKKLELY